MIIAVTLFWFLLDKSGILFQFSQALISSGLGIDVTGVFGAGRVAIVATVLACINVVLSTLLAVLLSAIYNTASALGGGIKLRFSNAR